MAHLLGPGYALLAELESDKELSSIKSAKEGLEDMRRLFEYLEVFGVLDKVRRYHLPLRLDLTHQMSLDMSLARGLDYYTGIIYEAIAEGSAPPSLSTNPSVPPQSSITDSTDDSQPSSSTSKSKSKSKAQAKDKDAEDGADETSVGVGSIAGGGRYDNLVGMFSAAAGGKGEQVPCVGVSVGVERIYSIMEMRRKGTGAKMRGKETEVYVMNIGKDGLLKERMALVKLLRDNGIKVSFCSPSGSEAE
jgi:histidyl-tRNA synthetase